MLIENKNICNGDLIIGGTRLTYNKTIEILKNMTIFEAIKQYPSLTLSGIIDCLVKLSNEEIINKATSIIRSNSIFHQ